MRSFTVNANDSGQRLDKFVTKTAKGLPTSKMYKFIRKKNIKVNGKRAEINQKLAVGDVVEMYIPDEFFSEVTSNEEYERADVQLNVVYEDENILLVDKKPGILVHTGDEGDKNRTEEAERTTLIFAIKAYLVSKGEYDPANENSFAPALCNRIDRNTGGIVIAAKNAPTLRAVNEAIKKRELGKFYLCAVHGIPEKKEATLKHYHLKHHKTNTVRVLNMQVPGSKEMITSYRTLKVNHRRDMALLEVTLLTGRTHQIRAHMASIGHSLVGDGKYGINASDRRLGYKYQALYSYKLRFDSDEEELLYLKGREFEVDKKEIFFLELFK
ncbi:MAG: RluA family pseudouridine synthase [Clostridia bacterium]|nr:RluA family pseudouridine synthase [Clostridia bacterium]